jgi:putative NIF3 family GTP cyclohydrolase 1 type 2
MPSFAVLRRMVEAEVDFLVCHEPTFWNHRDERPTDPSGRKKLEFIGDHDLVIVRNHDCWDRWPKIGIPSAWGRFLGLGEPVKGSGDVQYRHDIEPTELDEFAARVAARCAALGEPMVQVTGDPRAKVSRIGIGTGCICNVDVFRRMGCDCSIVTDDGGSYWSSIQRAADAGHPVIRVHHGVSEEPGMVTLTDYLNAEIPGLRATHVPQGCTYRLVGAGR